MARKGTTTKVGQGVSTKGKKSLATAKGKKKLAPRNPKELSSPDPASSDSGGSVLPIEIYKGSPDRVDFPRPTKRKRNTSASSNDPASAAGSPASSSGPASAANPPAILESPSVVQDPNVATSTANSTANDDLRYNEVIETFICNDLDHVSDWEDITLDPKLKRAMNNQILLPLALPTLSIGMTVGVLLHGVPGCGKTYLCQALAKAASVTFFNVECSSLISKWQGESEKLVRMLFKVAIERQPSIIFIDEVEGLMKQREDSDTFSVENIKRGILVEMSNVQAKRHLVTVIGASNRPEVLDEAFVRCFRLRLHIPPPDTTMKAKLLRTILNDVTHHLSQHEIVCLANNHVLEGASVAHMTDVIYTLYLDLAGSLTEAEYFHKTTQQDGSNVIVPYKPDPTLPLPKGCVHCSWKDFALEEQRLLRPNAIVYKDLYDAFEDSPSPIDAATLELHLQWSRRFGSRRRR